MNQNNFQKQTSEKNPRFLETVNLICEMLTDSKHSRNVFVVNYQTWTVTAYPGKKYWDTARRPGSALPADIADLHDWSHSILLCFYRRDRRDNGWTVKNELYNRIGKHISGTRLLNGLIKTIEEAQNEIQ